MLTSLLHPASRLIINGAALLHLHPLWGYRDKFSYLDSLADKQLADEFCFVERKCDIKIS